MRAWRRVALALVAVLAASVLAACATIPRTGPVTRGGSVSQDNGFTQIDYHPASPGKGDTQEQILSGFILAAVSPENGYQIARQFLSDSFRSQWNPDASVTVDQEALRSAPSRVGASELRISISPMAFIDQLGDYRSAASQSPVPLTYSFVKQHGQWRIAQAPPGIVIDSSAFQNVFSGHTLYFYSPDFHYLVPDLRWFPSSPASIATRIVKALLAGPSPWLADSVTTSFPKGAQLSSGSVVVSAGTAQVGLSPDAGGADATTVNRMDEQLTESLASSGTVTSVDLTIGGVSQNVGGVTDTESDPPVNSTPLVFKDGEFGFLSSKAPVALSGIGDKVAALHPRAATVSADGSAAAVLAGNAVYAVADSPAAATRVDQRPDLLPPSIDNRGLVWSATSNPAAPFTVAGGAAAPVSVRAAWPDARTLVSFAVSRDGTRLAALVTAVDGEPHLMVAGIVRDADGRPTRIGSPLDLGSVGLAQGLSLAWTDELTVAVLGESAVGGTAVVTQQLGGQLSSPQTGPANGAVIAGGNPSSQFWVLTSHGELETPAGNGWQTVTTGVTVLATQQGRG